MSYTTTIPSTPELDIDLAGVLKETNRVLQNLVTARKDLRSSQLEAKINKEQLQSLHQRLESDDYRAIPSEWKRLSKSLNNVIQVVSNRKDIAEYEQTIQKLTEENERLKEQLSCLEDKHSKDLDEQKAASKKELDREAAQYLKQISELTIDKELAASEASIKYDQLQSRVSRMRDENDERCSAIVARYEKMIQSLSDQKHKLREENMALQRREMELRDQLDHLQNHSTDFMLGMGGRRMAPIAMGGSQRYAEVVETIPLQSAAQSSQTFDSGMTVTRIDSSGSNSKKQYLQQENSAEVSSSNSSRFKAPDSPQHPGLGGHVAKPRKKRKLFSQTHGEC